LGRFAQADSIVPPGVRGYDRYAYGLNNPSRYTDPTGHSPCYADNYDDGPQCAKAGSPSKWYYDNWKYQHKVKEEIVKAVDDFDLGNGTIQVDAGVNGFTKLNGIRGNFSVAMDFKGNIAFLRTVGWGGYIGKGGGAGLGLTVTNAPSVYYLEGNDVEYGGQVGNVETVAAEVVLFKGEDRKIYKGISIAQQEELLLPWPFEVHGTITNTKIWGVINIPDNIANLLRWLP
jgi:hypothetical protein